jgi:hypothetical protein
MRRQITLLFFCLVSLPAQGEPRSSSILALPMGHEDSLHALIHVTDGAEVTTRVSRFVLSNATGTIISFLSLQAANLGVIVMFNGPAMPIDFWSASLLGGHALRLIFGLGSLPQIQKVAKARVEPGEERFTLTFADEEQSEVVRLLLARDPLLESREKFSTYRTLGLDLEAKLGTRATYHGSAQDYFVAETFRPDDVWHLQELVVTRVRVRASELQSGETNLIELNQFYLGKSCRNWLLRLARLVF